MNVGNYIHYLTHDHKTTDNKILILRDTCVIEIAQCELFLATMLLS